MSGQTQAVFRRLGFDHRPPKYPPPTTTPVQAQMFRLLRILFGLIWLYNTWTASSGINKLAVAHFLGLPLSSWPVHLAGNGIVLLNLYIALVLLSGKGMRSALWIAIVYLLGMWIVVEHGGDFNPAAGGTDAGIAPPYLIAMILTYTCWRISRPLSASSARTTRDHTLLWIHAARNIFGFLWAWDALFKWHPYFLTHFVNYLVDAQQGQPAWLVHYLQAFVYVIMHTDPLIFGLLAAATETIVAWSLLSGKLLRYLLPVGMAFSFLIWSTAEGFGGPYGNGRTGMPGNMFGTAVIYMLIFAYLMVLYRWPTRGEARELESPPVADEDRLMPDHD
ncbi:hypothetical protein BMS3Bbin12_00301 [bacterium BMS3Bbin12]|nr:hypothetical protein BMS3Abin12_01986 [bacterium BMS3Abin12]GBE47147.1 hypothetical protein BMS3Bbin12_00301 [bacterium BMS3Bbin12]GBE49546.1 hypothetical protein BMS3Bbin13_00465 [bacterium BMS3Bbin13]